MYYVVPTIIGMPVDFFRDINMQDLYYAEYEGKRFIIVKDDVELGQNNIDSQPQFFRMLKN